MLGVRNDPPGVARRPRLERNGKCQDEWKHQESNVGSSAMRDRRGDEDHGAVTWRRVRPTSRRARADRGFQDVAFHPRRHGVPLPVDDPKLRSERRSHLEVQGDPVRRPPRIARWAGRVVPFADNDPIDVGDPRRAGEVGPTAHAIVRRLRPDDRVTEDEGRLG